MEINKLWIWFKCALGICRCWQIMLQFLLINDYTYLWNVILVHIHIFTKWYTNSIESYLYDLGDEAGLDNNHGWGSWKIDK